MTKGTSIEGLAIKNGETPTGAHVQALEKAITLNSLSPGRGVRTVQLPWGTIPRYDGGRGRGGFGSTIFAPSVTRTGENFEIRWQRGLIEGIEPTIDGVPISGKDGVIPAFTVTPAAFSAGEALIYFRLSLSTGWGVTKIEPFASAEAPGTQPYIADKLALILFADGTFWRAMVANQGHLAINRRPEGIAQHLFWAKF